MDSSYARFGVKYLGSVVIGRDGPGAEIPEDADVEDLAYDEDKSLSDARFVTGDYISCAILSPLPDGSVAPVATARLDPVLGRSEARGSSRGGFTAREHGPGRGGARWGRGGRLDGGSGMYPRGEWRRGERLPEGSGPRSRGRGRW